MHPQTYICFIFLYSGMHTVPSLPQLACFHLLKGLAHFPCQHLYVYCTLKMAAYYFFVWMYDN